MFSWFNGGQQGELKSMWSKKDVKGENWLHSNEAAHGILRVGSYEVPSPKSQVPIVGSQKHIEIMVFMRSWLFYAKNIRIGFVSWV